MNVQRTNWKYFKYEEFLKCNPSCKITDMDYRTMNMLDTAREIAGIPFKINSAYRTVEWEIKKGRTGNSAHTKGKAVDIHCNNSFMRKKIIYGLIKAGFKRIGIGKTFIHADTDDLKPNAIWIY